MIEYSYILLLSLFQFSCFRDHAFESDILDCIKVLLRARHVDIYKKACLVIQNMISSRLAPYVEHSYWPARKSDNKTLEQYVPILVSKIWKNKCRI